MSNNKTRTPKALFAALVLLLALAVTSVPLFADGATRVVDEAGLFTAAQTAQIEAEVAKAIEKTGVDFFVITVDSLMGMSEPDFGEWVYETYGYGVMKETGGVIMYIDMSEREIVVMSAGSVEYIFKNTRTVEKLLDDIFDSLGSNRNYSAAALRFVKEASDLVLVKTQPWKARLSAEHIVACLVVAAIAGGVVVGIMLLMHRNSLPKAPSAHSYYAQEGVQVTHQADYFLHTHTSRVPIPRDPPPGSGGSGGGGSRSFSGSSGGGTSFSGGGRKF